MGFKLNKIFLKEIIVEDKFCSLCFDNFIISILLKKFCWLPTPHFTDLLRKVSQFFSLMNFFIPLTFDELFKDVLIAGVSSCRSSCSKTTLTQITLWPCNEKFILFYDFLHWTGSVIQIIGRFVFLFLRFAQALLRLLIAPGTQKAR